MTAEWLLLVTGAVAGFWAGRVRGADEKSYRKRQGAGFGGGPWGIDAQAFSGRGCRDR
jgi:hypothetical protein